MRSSSMARARACDGEASVCCSMISLICSPTVSTGLRAVIGSWKIMAMSLPRIFRSADCGAPISSLPRSFALPVERPLPGSRPNRAMEDMLLPEPDSPTIARISPGYTL